MRRLVLAGLVVLTTAGFSWFERWAAPDARLIDEHWHEHDPASSGRLDHTAWATFLDRHVAPDDAGVNRVRYAGISAADRVALDAYVAELAATEVTGLPKAEQLALWLNLYNALTVQAVLDAYPVDSIREIDDVWTVDRVTVEGRALSLDDIEHGIVRPIFAEPRIHYAVNCAAIGCPNLALEPFAGGSLEAQLDAAARTYVNDPRGVSVSTGGDVTASSIYNWFRDDFGDDEAAVLDHLRRYAEPSLRARLEGLGDIDAFAYDWGLNDAG